MAVLSQSCALAFHAMLYLPEPGGASVTLEEVARAFGVSRDHLAKVMQQLGRRRLVTSRRGPGGGYALARQARTVWLSEIYEAVSGCPDTDACLLGRPRRCGDAACCLDVITEEMRRILERFLTSTRLSDARGKFRRGKRNEG